MAKRTGEEHLEMSAPDDAPPAKKTKIADETGGGFGKLPPAASGGFGALAAGKTSSSAFPSPPPASKSTSGFGFGFGIVCLLMGAVLSWKATKEYHQLQAVSAPDYSLDD